MSSNAMEINKALQQDRFRSQMQSFADWKAELAKTIKGFQQWLNQNDAGTPEIELRLFDAIQALNTDKLTIAFVAEFSRGKTELINAIFFADYGRRLLPSEAGRTTMCPTELLYDHETDMSYIKLLPIDTRLSDISLTDLKNEDSYWTTLPLNIDSADQMAESFLEVIKTKQVSHEEADKLGLLVDADVADNEKENTSDTSTIEIPMWRHAIVSFPHPLLKQGLVILDTPGLNALGTEPELTLNMLPSAQAVLFVLSADAGVSRSDLDMWKNHIKAYRNKQKSGLIAVMNKIDTLWDEMKNPDEVDASIQEQCKISANLLGIDAENVFPVSAQKALLAKIRSNDELLAKSKLPALEALLATDILPAKQRVIWDNIVAGLDQAIDNAYAPIANQIHDLKDQIKELNTISGKSDEVVKHLLIKAKQQKAAYSESVKNFQASRRKLAMQAKVMFNTLGIEAIDQMIEKTRQDMAGSWTTPGLKNGMGVFFESIRDAMQITERHANQTHKLVLSIYLKFHKEHGLQVKKPPTFNLKKHSDKLDQIYLKGEEFRNSRATTLTEQSFVIKNFFVSLVSHARDIFADANRDAENWLKEIVNPLVKQIQDKRDRIDRHMATLTKVKESKNSLEIKIKGLKTQISIYEKQAEALKQMHKTLMSCTPPEDPSAKSQNAANSPVH